MKKPTQEELNRMYPEQISQLFIQKCDCKGFEHYNAITFDSQDLYEQGKTRCPICKKQFEFQPEYNDVEEPEVEKECDPNVFEEIDDLYSKIKKEAMFKKSYKRIIELTSLYETVEHRDMLNACFVYFKQSDGTFMVIKNRFGINGKYEAREFYMQLKANMQFDYDNSIYALRSDESNESHVEQIMQYVQLLEQIINTHIKTPKKGFFKELCNIFTPQHFIKS